MELALGATRGELGAAVGEAVAREPEPGKEWAHLKGQGVEVKPAGISVASALGPEQRGNRAVTDSWIPPRAAETR